MGGSQRAPLALCFQCFWTGGGDAKRGYGTATEIPARLEFRKLKVTLAKPEASAETKPTDPVDRLIESLTAQVQELAK